MQSFDELVVRHILVIKIVLHVDFWFGPRYARKNNLATYFVSSLFYVDFLNDDCMGNRHSVSAVRDGNGLFKG